jgi:hypothetical protein
MKVDYDMALLVLASGLSRLIAKRMGGCGDTQARQIFRDHLIDCRWARRWKRTVTSRSL